MTWYHLYLVMSLHDDRMCPGISFTFEVSASFETHSVCRAPSPIQTSGAAKRGTQHHRQVRMSPALYRRMQLCFSNSWLTRFMECNDAQIRDPFGRYTRTRTEVLGTPDLPIEYQLWMPIPASSDKQSCSNQGEPRMHNRHQDSQPRITLSPDRSRWRTHRWKIRRWHRRPRANRPIFPLLQYLWSYTCRWTHLQGPRGRTSCSAAFEAKPQPVWCNTAVNDPPEYDPPLHKATQSFELSDFLSLSLSGPKSGRRVERDTSGARVATAAPLSREPVPRLLHKGFRAKQGARHRRQASDSDFSSLISRAMLRRAAHTVPIMSIVYRCKQTGVAATAVPHHGDGSSHGWTAKRAYRRARQRASAAGGTWYKGRQMHRKGAANPRCTMGTICHTIPTPICLFPRATLGSCHPTGHSPLPRHQAITAGQ